MGNDSSVLAKHGGGGLIGHGRRMSKAQSSSLLSDINRINSRTKRQQQIQKEEERSATNFPQNEKKKFAETETFLQNFLIREFPSRFLSWNRAFVFLYSLFGLIMPFISSIFSFQSEFAGSIN
jgi:hypothetical protein